MGRALERESGSAPLEGPVPERRNLVIRGQVFERVLRHVVENPHARFTFRRFQRMLDVPDAAAQRILTNLISAGVVVESERDVWSRTWSDVLPERD
jgi:hypothetical protein